MVVVSLSTSLDDPLELDADPPPPPLTLPAEEDDDVALVDDVLAAAKASCAVELVPAYAKLPAAVVLPVTEVMSRSFVENVGPGEKGLPFNHARKPRFLRFMSTKDGKGLYFSA